MKEWITRRHMAIALLVTLLVLSWGIPIGVNIWYTNNSNHNECQALGIIKDAGLRNHKFEVAVQHWFSSDGC